MKEGISIGDIHGRPYWKDIPFKNYKKVVFNGDYVDSYHYSNKQTEDNLKDIIQFKRDNPELVTLLLGNHDIQYMWDYNSFGCSGFRPEMYQDLHGLFNDNKDLFEIAFQIDNRIWTHAGISKGWYESVKDVLDKYAETFETKNLAETLNSILWSKDNHYLHRVGDLRGGIYPYGGITWADRRETKDDYLIGYHQIVGHTPIDRITKFGDEKGSITYIDVLRRYLDRETDKLPLWEFFYEFEV